MNKMHPEIKTYWKSLGGFIEIYAHFADCLIGKKTWIFYIWKVRDGISYYKVDNSEMLYDEKTALRLIKISAFL